jgi:hypothetical protein
MSDRLNGQAKAGATSLRFNIKLLKSSDGTALTGRVAADLTAYYWRPGDAASTVISLTNATNLNDAYSSGKVKEVDATHMPGVYRIDLPDAMLAAGVDFVHLTVTCATAYDYDERIALESVGAAEVYAKVLDAAGTRAALGEATANLDTQLTTIAGYIDTEVAAIKAKTDLIAGTPTVPSDIPTTGQIVAAILAAAVTNPTAAPTAPYTVDDVLSFLLAILKFKREQTATLETLYQDNGTTPLATSAKSDDGTVFLRSEYT